jgi:hypothetical protein
MKNGRDAMAVAFMGYQLFIVGGSDGQAYLNFVEAYDPFTNLWQQVTQYRISYYSLFINRFVPSLVAHLNPSSII